MKYLVIDVKDGDMFVEGYETKHEALERATYLWNSLTDKEKKDRDEFYVLESVSPDETAPNHYDGQVIKDYIRRCENI